MLFRRPLRHVARLSALPPLGILSTLRLGVASCPEHRFRLVGIDVGRNQVRSGLASDPAEVNRINFSAVCLHQLGHSGNVGRLDLQPGDIMRGLFS